MHAEMPINTTNMHTNHWEDLPMAISIARWCPQLPPLTFFQLSQHMIMFYTDMCRVDHPHCINWTQFESGKNMPWVPPFALPLCTCTYFIWTGNCSKVKQHLSGRVYYSVVPHTLGQSLKPFSHKTLLDTYIVIPVENSLLLSNV